MMEALKQINPADFKISATKAYDICAGKVGITDKQMSTIWELETKLKEKGKITDLQMVSLVDLRNKRDNPTLPAGAISYCKLWIQQRLYGRKKTFTSKYTAKGLWVESQAMGMIREYMKLDSLSQNDEMLEDEWMKGVPDVNDEIGIDCKSPWDCFSFPLFDDVLDPTYFYQGQVYMALTGKAEWHFVYVLCNAPDHMIMSEARKWCYNEGIEMTPAIFDEFKEKMTYDNIPMELRIKPYTVSRDEMVIADIKNRVEMCRSWIAEEIKRRTEAGGD